MQTVQAKACYTEREAAAMLSISTRTLFTLRAANRIQYIKLSGPKRSRVLYPHEAIEKFVKDNIVRPAADSAVSVA